MLRTPLLAFLLWLPFAAPGFAAGPQTYWPGFTGTVAEFNVPLDAATPKDRYFTLKIRLPADPKAHPDAYAAAFRAACQRHQGKLLATAKRLSPATDWRVKVFFLWHVASAKGVSLDASQHSYLWLSNCRLVETKAAERP